MTWSAFYYLLIASAHGYKERDQDQDVGTFYYLLIASANVVGYLQREAQLPFLLSLDCFLQAPLLGDGGRPDLAFYYLLIASQDPDGPGREGVQGSALSTIS